MNDLHSPLVSVDWLASKLKTPGIVTLDATFLLPHQGKNGYTEFQQGHLPESLFFDIDKIADQHSTLPHMLPSANQFSESVGRLGIDNTTHVIVYDNNSFMASARVWWTFRVFGHHQVSVLDGGLKFWKSLNLPIEQRTHQAAPRLFKSDYQASLVRNIAEMLQHVARTDTQIVDARSSGRFAGSENELRPGLRCGHMPNSLNLPFLELVDPETGQLNSPDTLTNLFQSVGVKCEEPIVASCGSGVTASILALALYRIGKTDVPVYDGSWSEWGGRPDTPVAKSESE